MAKKYRCPYCAEMAFTPVDRMGITAALMGSPYFYYGPPPYAITCSCCQKTSNRMLGALGRKWNHRPHSWLLCLLPYLCLAVIPFVAIFRQKVGIFIVGYLAVFTVKAIANYLFVYFDKRTAQERDADARLTFAVTAEGARVKKCEIYLLRFPKRGTNAYSPVIYAMVCGKSGKKGERVLTLRVIRSDNMDLPDVGESALLVTRTNKVVEGTVTSVTPKKELYLPDE